MSIGIRGLLVSRRFAPLFLTQFFGAFNDNAYKNAVVLFITFVVAQRAELNAQLFVILAAGLFTVPSFLFSAFAGLLADKYDKSNLIRLIKAAEVLIMLLGVVGFIRGDPYWLLFVLFLMGTHSAFFGPLKYAIIPQLINTDELIEGNALIESTTFLAILLGSIFGGIGVSSSEGIWVVSSLIMVIALCGLACSWFIPKTECLAPDLVIGKNVVGEIGCVISQSRQYRSAFMAILAIAWFWFLGAAFLIQFPTYVKDVVGGNETLVTLFLAIFSVGIGLGSLFCNRLLRGQIHATYVPLGAFGISLFTLDLYVMTLGESVYTGSSMGIGLFLSSWAHWRIALDLFLIAFCGGLYNVPLYAIMQHETPNKFRARMVACSNILGALFVTLASVISYALFQFGFTSAGVLLFIALGNMVAVVMTFRLLPRFALRMVLKSLFKLFYRIEVKGLSHYEAMGKNGVVVANHTSWLDGLLLAVYLPDELSFAVHTHTASRWFLRLFYKLTRVYTVDPANPMAVKGMIDLVKSGHRLVIFPEGRLTVTGALMKIYEGPALIALNTRASILAVRIEGAQFSPWSRLRGKVRIRWFPRITLTITPPERLNVPENVSGRQRRQIAGQQLYHLMTDMMFATSLTQLTLFESLLDAQKTYGGRHIIAEDTTRRTFTYRMLIRRCFVLGNQLQRSTARGETVGVLLPNSIAAVVTFFALQATGRVPVMLNYSAGRAAIVSACQTAQVKRVVTSHAFVERGGLESLITALEQAGVLIDALEAYRDAISIRQKWFAFWASWVPEWTYARLNPRVRSHSPAVVLFTSGSEGLPKGVVLSHDNIMANRAQLSACVDFAADDRVFAALPMFHAFGLTGAVLLPLLSGVKVFLYPSPLHYRVITELIYDTDSTLFFSTDSFLKGYAKYANPYDFYSVRYIFAGAEPLHADTYQYWAEQYGLRIFEGYGVTEASPVIASNTPMHHKQGTVGQFLPGISYQLEPVPGIESGGRLGVSGPNIMLGYYLAESPGKLVSPKDGWYDTGDIASVDDEGYLRILGRAKRFAKIAGEMVSLTAVEAFSQACWPDFEQAVLAVSDARKGQQLLLLTTNPEAKRTDLLAYAKQHGISELWVAKKVIKVDQLPKLGTGKVDYVTLMGEYATQ